MLSETQRGYAVMNKELTAYSIEHPSYEQCKKYCRSGYVIVERIPYVCGFVLNVSWFEDWNKPIQLRTSLKNILWLHWRVSKKYAHKTGEIVYEG